MIHLTDRRCASCIQYASDILWERTGWRLPTPKIEEGADNAAKYKEQMEEARVNLRPLSEIEDNAIIFYKGGRGYHIGVYAKELDRVVHGAAGKKSTATKISEMSRLYDQVGIYRLQGGAPGNIHPDFHKAEFFDPVTAIIVGIVAIGASVLIKNYLDRGNKDLPEREPQNTFNLVGGQNQTRPDEALPWTAGRIRAYPDFSIPPYNRYVGQTNDQGDRNSPIQEYRAGLNWGVGRLRLEQLRLGDTDFLQFLAFDSPNSFDVVGDENERPPWWQGNVGGARARTETFSVFTELDYREPGFIQFTVGGAGEGVSGTSSILPGAAGTTVNIAGVDFAIGTDITDTQVQVGILDNAGVIETFAELIQAGVPIQELFDTSLPSGVVPTVADINIVAATISAAIERAERGGGSGGSGLGGGGGEGGDQGSRGGSGFGGPGEGNPGDNEGPGGGGGGGDN